MKKRTLAGLGLAAALTISGLAPQAASAYPPGRALSMSSDGNLVQFRSNDVHITVSNLAIGKLKFSVNGKESKYFSTRISGDTQSWYFHPAAPGKYVITGTSGIESKSTTVYVPKQSVPRKVSVKKGFTVRSTYVAPGTLVILSVGGKRVASATADADGIVNLVAPVGSLSRGTNQYYIIYGGAFTSGGKISGLK